MDRPASEEGWRKYYEGFHASYGKELSRLRAERAALQEQIGRMWSILRRHKLIEEYCSEGEDE
jgi:hypothetical protein